MSRTSIRETRGKDYGDFGINMRALTKCIEAIVSQALQQDVTLPPQTGALVMTQAKILREAYKHKKDNVDDGLNYLEEVLDLI